MQAVGFKLTTIELAEWSPNQPILPSVPVIEMSGNKYLSMSIQCTFLSSPYSLPSQRNFHISFKPKVAIAKVIIKKSRGEGSLMEQDTIEFVS